jgi:diguanylate cyclase (GGDEF)-like protein
MVLLLSLPFANAARLYGQEQGLPNLQVEATALDSAGLVWVATDEGVFRFDGHRFLRIALEPSNVSSVQSASGLLSAPGVMYIATRANLWRYILATGATELVRQPNGAQLPGAHLALTHDGWMYAGLGSSELWRWRHGLPSPQPEKFALQFPPLAADESAENGAPGVGALTSVYAGPSGLWLLSQRGAFAVDVLTGHVKPLHINAPELRNGRIPIMAAQEFPAGVLWLGAWNDGLLRVDLRTQQHLWFHPKLPNAGALRATSIYHFAAREDRLYIGTNRGLVVYRNDCACVRGLNHPSWDQVNGAGIVVVDVSLGAHELWAGVWGGGLAHFSAADEVFEHQMKVDNMPSSLANSVVRALHSDGQRLWLGSYGGGVQSVAIAQMKPGEMWPWQTLALSASKIESQFIWYLDSSAGGLDIGTGYGQFRWHDGQQKSLDVQDPVQVSPARKPSASPAVLESVRAGLRTRDGRYYVGSTRGLYREYQQGLRQVLLPDFLPGFLPDSLPNSLPNSLPGNTSPGVQISSSIFSISEHDGELYLGTENGLLRLDAAEKVIAQHVIGDANVDSSGGPIWVQKRDALGQLWLGTSHGLFSLNQAPVFQFTPHPAVSKLGVRNVQSIEFDAAGQLWLGTSNGLVQYQPKAGRAQLYNRFDGLVTDQFSTNVSAHIGNRLFFGGNGGLVSFDPSALAQRKAVLTPSVTRWRLGQNPWQAASASLHLPQNHEPIQFELSALNFLMPEQLRYAYRWRETDASFTDLGDAQSMLFAHLPSGRNTLELRASLSALDASATRVVVTIDIPFAWYQTWWGRALLAAAILLSGYILVALRTAVVRQRARVLQIEVNERTAQLSATADALTKANARLLSQATVDPLTGLSNRRQLFERKISAAQGIGVLMCDLDHFKSINDQYGHHAGDQVLLHFAEALKQLCAPEDLAVRYGGEEFLVLHLDGTVEALIALAERILQQTRLGKVALSDAINLSYSASIGIAFGPAGSGLDAVIRQADQALYLAKNSGRNCWRRF